MDKKEKLLIYPYDIEAVPMLRHKGLLRDYEICGLVSPEGWGLTGKDAGCADGGSELGIMIGSDFEAGLESCDAVYFGESHMKLDFEASVRPRLLKAIAAGKNIIFTLPVDRRVQEEISGLCSDGGVYFKYFGNQKDIGEFLGKEELYELNTPVIFVLGISERTQKFHIQLALREYIQGLGYKVSQVGSRSYCELLGFRSFPQFMYDNSFSESQKIILFNRYIKSIEIKEEPDVIIIGIPGGTMPFDNKFTNRFGMTAYEVSRAVTPDAAIFSIFYGAYEQEQLESVFTSVKYRLGFEIDCFNLSNVKFDWEASRQDEELSYITVDSKFLHGAGEKYGSMAIPVYSVLEAEDAAEMNRLIIGRLEEYAEVQSV